jgi:hypothetical protein
MHKTMVIPVMMLGKRRVKPSALFTLHPMLIAK